MYGMAIKHNYKHELCTQRFMCSSPNTQCDSIWDRAFKEVVKVK
jgi:hypothetical protein